MSIYGGPPTLLLDAEAEDSSSPGGAVNVFERYSAPASPPQPERRAPKRPPGVRAKRAGLPPGVLALSTLISACVGLLMITDLTVGHRTLRAARPPAVHPRVSRLATAPLTLPGGPLRHDVPAPPRHARRLIHALRRAPGRRARPRHLAPVVSHAPSPPASAAPLPVQPVTAPRPVYRSAPATASSEFSFER